MPYFTWRPNMTACEDMAANVAEAVKQLSEDDCVVIHCFDNIAFMARSEEGGIFLSANLQQENIILKATLFWQARSGSICIQKLHGYIQVAGEVYGFLSITQPRYLYKACCTHEDHAPNIREDGFEDSLRRSLMECRGYYKDFFSPAGTRILQFSTQGSRCRARTRPDYNCGVQTRCMRCQRATTGLRICC